MPGGAGVVDDPVEPTARLLALLRLDQTDHDTVRQAGFGGCLCDGHDFGIMGRGPKLWGRLFIALQSPLNPLRLGVLSEAGVRFNGQEIAF